MMRLSLSGQITTWVYRTQTDTVVIQAKGLSAKRYI